MALHFGAGWFSLPCLLLCLVNSAVAGPVQYVVQNLNDRNNDLLLEEQKAAPEPLNLIYDPRIDNVSNPNLEARLQLREMNDNLTEYLVASQDAAWAYNTNVTDYNTEAMNNASALFSVMYNSWWEDTIMDFNESTSEVSDPFVRRQFEIQQSIGTAILNETDLNELNNRISSMTDKLNNKVCSFDDMKCDADTEGLTIDQLEVEMGVNKDYTELLYYWEKWRDVSGKQMTDDYPPYVELLDEAAVMNGFDDASQMWIDPYTSQNYSSNDFRDDIEGLWEEVHDFYVNLHAYVRWKLKDYSDYGNYFNDDGLIPAHILGNMYAQSWENIYDIVVPYPNTSLIDLTPMLEQKITNVTEMFEIAENFFLSLGMYKMTPDFWNNSLYEQPPDRTVICHASAWDFFSTDNPVKNNTVDGRFRIKMCTDKNQDDFITIHHEMGHTQYQMAYSYFEPLIYRDGANPGFHEAIGDTIALSVSTPSHLEAIEAYLNNTKKQQRITEPSYMQNINFLMKQALTKVAFLPFAYILDQWRWEVFEGRFGSDVYNKEWWRKRIDYQGIRPPIRRTADTDFDIGCKFHVPANVPYIRYFVATILQFQFHERLCEVANITGPVFNCDIYNSTDAGTVLLEMLRKGRSVPWQEQLADFLDSTGEMSAQSILHYFEPLIIYLNETIDKNNIEVGWDNSTLGDYISKGEEISAIVPIIVGAVLAVLVCLVVVAFFVGQRKRKIEEKKQLKEEMGKANEALEMDEKNDI